MSVQVSQLIQVDGSLGPDRARAWQADLSRVVPGMDVEAPDLKFGNIAAFDFAGARLWSIESDRQRVFRSRPCANRFAPMAIVILDGEVTVTQLGRQCTLRPGEFTYIDSARPLTLDYSSHFQQLSLHFPRTAFVPRTFSNAVALPCRSDWGADRSFSSTVIEMWATAPHLYPSQHATALTALLSLARLTTAMTDTGQEKLLSPIVVRAMAFIEHKLGEDWLNAEAVAERQGISRRRLDDLFSQTGKSVTGWIWERRLVRSADELLAPNAAERSIIDIALEMGFKTQSHFCRMFVSRFGSPPSLYRQRHLEASKFPN